MQLDEREKGRFEELSGGKSVNKAASTFTGELNEYIENVRKVHEQIIDTVNQDKLVKAQWDSYSKDKAQEVVFMGS